MIEEIKEYLKNKLSPIRYNHSLKVADCARDLAMIHEENASDAYLAGLLHDCARELEYDEKRNWVALLNLDEQLLKEKSNNLTHAEFGAEIARIEYHVNDNIYLAIKYHTIGNSKMNKFAKIIFIADKIARDNLNEDLLEVKARAYKNLDQALLLFLNTEEEYLKTKGKSFCSETKKLKVLLEANIKA